MGNLPLVLGGIALTAFSMFGPFEKQTGKRTTELRKFGVASGLAVTFAGGIYPEGGASFAANMKRIGSQTRTAFSRSARARSGSRYSYR